MKAPSFEYCRAETSEHAVDLLAQGGPDSRPIAGGQSLGPMLNLRIARPSLLVDIRRCRDLRQFDDQQDAVIYGAAITHAELEDGQVPDPTGGWLRQCAQAIAYRAVRNRGTLGGSIAHADPAADWLSLLLLAQTEVITRAKTGMKRMRLEDFVTGPFSTTLGEAELLVGLRVPRVAKRQYGHCKLSVKQGEFAQALAAVSYQPDTGDWRAVVGAIEDKPLMLSDAAHLSKLSRVALQAEIDALLPGLPATLLRLHSVALHRAFKNCLDQ